MSIVFNTRPFGMQWTETPDQQNLYVSSVDVGGQAHTLGVIAGSRIICLNHTVIENTGAKQIFQFSKQQQLPLRITFRLPDNCNQQPPMMQTPQQPMMMQQPQQPMMQQPMMVQQQPQQPMMMQQQQPPPQMMQQPVQPSFGSTSFAPPGAAPVDIAPPADLPFSPGANEDTSKSKNVDYDDLEARFAALSGDIDPKK